MTDDHRTDDPTIPDSDRLFRRVPPNQVIKEENGTWRPSSAVFKTKELSVNIESLMTAQGRAPLETLKDFPSMYLTSIIAGRARQYQQRIVKDVEPPNDPAHGLVLGRKDKFAQVMCQEHQWIKTPT